MGVDSTIDNGITQILSLLFALSSFLIFPLVIPMLRFYTEIYKAIKVYNESTISYTQDSKKYREQLENYFQILYKLNVLYSSIRNTDTPSTNDMRKNDGDIINNKKLRKSIKNIFWMFFKKHK